MFPLDAVVDGDVTKAEFAVFLDVKFGEGAMAFLFLECFDFLTFSVGDCASTALTGGAQRRRPNTRTLL